MKFRFSDPSKGGRCFSIGQEFGKQELQPFEQEMEVAVGCGEHGVHGIASTMRQIFAAHAVFGLKMTPIMFCKVGMTVANVWP